MPIKKRILIYEPSHAGHHLKYVQLLVRAFSSLGRDVILASTRESFASEEYALLLKRHENLFATVTVDHRGLGRRLKPWLDAWSILELAARYRCDCVFLPYLDSYLRALGILGAVYPSARNACFEGILMDGACSLDAVHGSVGQRMRRLATRRALARGILRKVYFLDESILASYRRNIPGARSQMVPCPDPIETDHTIPREEFRARFGIRSDARVLGVFGMIDARKGVDLLIRAFERYGPQSHECLLLMGKHTPAVLDHIRTCRAAPNIVSVDRFVTDDEMISGIHAADAVAAVYPRHLSSASIVIRAAAAGKPVLGGNFGWIGRVVGRHGLGRVCDPLDQAALVHGIEWAFDDPRLDLDRASRFARENSAERFVEVICSEVD